MKKIYIFFEIVYVRLNNISLKGQSQENNAHFSAFILSLLIDFNIITILMLLEKLKIASFCLNDEYSIIVLVSFTYFLCFLLFIRKEKYKTLKIKYSNSDLIFKTGKKYYLSIYMILTFVVFVMILLL